MHYYGYAGGILYVDLTSGQTRTEPLDMEMAKKFIGGWGIGERLLYNLLKPGTDPLSPDNPIIIVLAHWWVRALHQLVKSSY